MLHPTLISGDFDSLRSNTRHYYEKIVKVNRFVSTYSIQLTILCLLRCLGLFFTDRPLLTTCYAFIFSWFPCRPWF